MKFSVKLLDEQHTHHHPPDDHRKHYHVPPVLLRAKIPVTIFNLPFLSHFSTSHPSSDLSLSLSTNFSSGPSLKLSYSAAPSTSSPPFTLSLKSGTGLFGSPNNSPLLISAHFSFNPTNPNHPNPTFSLFLKPQLGSFSLRKSTFSHPIPKHEAAAESNSFGFVPLERPQAVVENDHSHVVVVEKGDDSDSNRFLSSSSMFKGIRLMANTEMAMGKRVGLNCRWGVCFPEDLGVPALRINKIGICRVDDGGLVEEERKKKKKREEEEEEGKSRGEVEMLKGMCFWMKRELDVLTRINSEMKCELAELKGGSHIHRGGSVGGAGAGAYSVVSRESVRKKGSPSQSVGSSSSSDEYWRSKKIDVDNGQVNGKKEEKKIGNLAVDVENELHKALKAAAASST